MRQTQTIDSIIDGMWEFPVAENGVPSNEHFRLAIGLDIAHSLRSIHTVLSDIRKELRPVIREVMAPKHVHSNDTPILNQSISDSLGQKMSIRARKCLIMLGIKTVGQLVQVNAETILEQRNVGATTLGEIRDLLAEHGLSLAGENEEVEEPPSPVSALGPDSYPNLRIRNLTLIRDMLGSKTIKAAAEKNDLSPDRARQIAVRFCHRTVPSVHWHPHFRDKLLLHREKLLKILDDCAASLTKDQKD